MVKLLAAILLLNGGVQDNDSARLSELNRQFIQNFLQQDVAAQNKLIHPNFVCIESNGKIVHRKGYLKNGAMEICTGAADTCTVRRTIHHTRGRLFTVNIERLSCFNG